MECMEWQREKLGCISTIRMYMYVYISIRTYKQIVGMCGLSVVNSLAVRDVQTWLTPRSFSKSLDYS